MFSIRASNHDNTNEVSNAFPPKDDGYALVLREVKGDSRIYFLIWQPIPASNS